MSGIELGRIEALYRYPVKSMRGERLDEAALGWHGLDGDRRHAFRRLALGGGFPWLTATKLPELLLFTPRGDQVITPGGEALPLRGDALAADVAGRCGEPVEMMELLHGMFDEATVSVITSDTVAEVCRLAERAPDPRRFRPNVLLRSARGVAFEEDVWVGGVLAFGDGDDAPAVAITMRDLRCAMVNYDPDDAAAAPAMMKAAVHANQNHAGVYATVTRTGRLAVGQTVWLRDR